MSVDGDARLQLLEPVEDSRYCSSSAVQLSTQVIGAATAPSTRVF